MVFIASQRLWILTAAAACTVVSTTDAALFTETFDDPMEAAVGSAPLRDDGSAYDDNEKFTVQDSVIAFGSQYGQLNDDSGTTADANWNGENDIPAASNALTTTRFRFYEPGTPSNATSFAELILGPTTNPTQARAIVRFDDGTAIVRSTGVSGDQTFSYSIDTLHTVEIVVNDTGSTQAYDNIADSIDSDRYDVWLDGQLVVENLEYENNTQGFDSFAWDTPNGGRQLFLIDDFVVEAGATPVPEPATLALAAIAGLHMLPRHRARG